MAFLIFERTLAGGVGVLRPTGETFMLAGYNLVYGAWEKKGHPINEGWQVPADELIQLQTKGHHTYDTRRLIIDWDPKSKRRIGLIELLDIYAYTYADEKTPPGKAAWTVMMLRMRDAFRKQYEHEICPQEKAERIASIPEPSPGPEFPEFIEFLYLAGSNKGWKWGMNGATNAVFLYDDARAYFSKFF
jgi:hypothetical protein